MGGGEGNEKASLIQSHLLLNFLRGAIKLHPCRGAQESHCVWFGARSHRSRKSPLNVGLQKQAKMEFNSLGLDLFCSTC